MSVSIMIILFNIEEAISSLQKLCSFFYDIMKYIRIKNQTLELGLW